MSYQTREDWLNAFIDAARPKFDAANAPLPINTRVSVGFTSKGYRSNRIGECWSSDASEDGHYEIFIKPTLDNAAKLCEVLTHELIHAAVGIPAGHGPAFKRVALSLGLGGKMTSTHATAAWYVWALPIIEALGPIPYAAIADSGLSSGKPKQFTALIKAQCPACGFTARVTRKWINSVDHLNCSIPDCVGQLVCEI